MYVKAKLAAEDVKRLDRHAATVDFGVRRDDMQYGDLMELHLHSRVGRAPKPPYDHTMKVKVGVEWHGIGSPRLTSAAREGATTLRRVYQGTAAEQFAALEAIAAKKADAAPEAKKAAVPSHHPLTTPSPHPLIATLSPPSYHALTTLSPRSYHALTIYALQDQAPAVVDKAMAGKPGFNNLGQPSSPGELHCALAPHACSPHR